MPWAWCGVFVLQLCVQVLYVLHLYAVQARQPTRATAVGTMGYVVWAGVWYNFTVDPWLLVPAAAGYAVGTWLTVCWEVRQGTKEVHYAPKPAAGRAGHVHAAAHR
jgi:hypothetical protein